MINSVKRTTTKIITYDPRQQLNSICESIRDYFSSTTGINSHKIVVTILYRLGDSDEWQWVDEAVMLANIDSESTQKLVDNRNSTFYYVLNEQNEKLYNDKQVAHQEEHYVYDGADRSHDKIGSIACYKIQIPTQNGSITSVLSISSYGYRFVESNDKAEIESFNTILRDSIIPQYTSRITIELINLYINEKISDSQTVNN